MPLDVVLVNQLVQDPDMAWHVNVCQLPMVLFHLMDMVDVLVRWENDQSITAVLAVLGYVFVVYETQTGQLLKE